MNTETSLAVGGVIGAISKFVMMSGVTTGAIATLYVIGITTAVFAVFGWSHGNFTRETSWNYLVEWANALVAAAAAFHGTNEAVKKIAGTGDGTIDTNRFKG